MAAFEQQQSRTQSSYQAGPARPDRANSQPALMKKPLIAQQQSLGNQAVQRLLRSGAIQTKLTINEPGDQYEQEADRVADAVMRMPDPGATKGAAVPRQAQGDRIQRVCSECEEELHRQPTEERAAITEQAQIPYIQRMCPECQEKLHRQSVEEEEEIPQAKEVAGHTPQVTPDVQARIDALRGGGQPLPQSVRAFFEPRFGHDFSHVRVHTDARAAESAQAMNALAYTTGREVVFGAGQYAPETTSGRKLLAHELMHVIQQARTGPALQRQERSHVRFPTLEIAALRGQAAFATGSSPLTSGEISDARLVFGNSIDLSRVRIVYSPVISAPTTLGDTIRVPPTYAMPRRVLVHELAHIWQFQTKGSAYISDSVFHQTAAFLTRGDRGAAYDYTIVPGKSFHDYTAEQQASIIEDYFAYSSLRTDAEYQRLISQVRATSPMAVPPAFFEEMAAGLPPRGFELPSRTGEERLREGVGVPLLEFRFPGL